ncbi:hypothetical protein BX286_6308 [Streptomyces sp. 3211.6]|uniref:DUF6624 domain-containing protein n=1 Tax=Streptomyces sp. 3211.6 TaxID=1938845 RepID=UPI000EAF7DA8|nr:DUF6624 domain-containing protein [Streptomyces sp. 3211.6]RKT08224.1 hypothetical protein BX286_6308 [Streptomyces sp. 3211.6]
MSLTTATPTAPLGTSAEVTMPPLPEVLLAQAARDEALTLWASSLPGASNRRLEVAAVRAGHERELMRIVDRHGWPTVDLVGAKASAAALRILLHGTDLAFLLRCRDLIKTAAEEEGSCSLIHLAYVVDWCLVRLAQPQLYGTAFNPAFGRPYPIADLETLDERRNEMCLPPLAEEIALHRARRLAS